MKILCPEIATYISNCYIKPARLFIAGGGELSSKEGTTQGDPIAMGMYALGFMPLLTSGITSETNKLVQIAFADDLTGVGTIDELQKWWENVLYYGPYLGYHVNELKSWLITKEDYLEQARQKFRNSAIKITTEGHRHLGAVVGNQENKESYVAEKVASWVKEIDMLSNISRTQHHATYSAFIHGLRHRYTYIMRTVPEISAILKPLDKAIDNFITVLFQGYLFNEDERALLSLPARLGGMGFIIPSETCRQQYQNSRQITAATTEKVKYGENIFSRNDKESTKIKTNIKNNKRKNDADQLEDLKHKITSRSTLRSIQAANENGDSIWLTVLPIKQNGFFLDKQAFWDATHIRYDMPLERIPTSCECGCRFDIQHAFSCPKGGFVITRHNEIRDITAELLTEICKNVTVEPALTPLTGETFPASAITSSHARADVSARGFWIKGANGVLRCKGF